MIRTHNPISSGPSPRALTGAGALRKTSTTDFLVKAAALERVPGRFQGAVTYPIRARDCASSEEAQTRALLEKPRNVTERTSRSKLRIGGTFSAVRRHSAHIAERKFSGSKDVRAVCSGISLHVDTKGGSGAVTRAHACSTRRILTQDIARKAMKIAGMGSGGVGASTAGV